MEVIRAFTGPYRWLSNFWPATVVLDGIEYPTVEHAYQAAKTENDAQRDHVRRAPTPGEAKRAGRNVRMRPDWDQIKLAVMANLVQQKFSHPSLREQLLATGDAVLEEGNNWGDRFWGICNGRGHNHLGRLLMQVRSNLQ